MSEPRVVLSTHPTFEQAKEMAEQLVSERLAACVNLIPSAHSIYRWKEKVESEPETVMIIKTASGQEEALEARLQELHPYEVPEFVVLSPERLSEGYRSWLMDSTQG